MPVYEAFRKLSQLEEEDPQLHMVWNEQLSEIHVQLMGEVQLEILQRLIADSNLRELTSRQMQQVVDGKGAWRLAQALLSFVKAE